MLRTLQFAVGLILLTALEVMRAYFIVPPGSDVGSATADIALFLHENIFYLRAIGFLIIIFPLLNFFTMGTKRSKIMASVAVILYIMIFWMFNFGSASNKIS